MLEAAWVLLVQLKVHILQWPFRSPLQMFILSKGGAAIFTAGGIYLAEVQHLDLVKLFKIS